MFSEIKITDPKTDTEIVVAFYYDLSKGQPATFTDPEYPDQICDLWFNTDLYSERFCKIIDSEREYVEEQIWKEVEEIKKSVLYDKAVNDLDEGLKI